VHVARGSCSFTGSLFKVPLARGSDPLICVGLYLFGLNSLTLGYFRLGYVGLCCLRYGWVELCCFKFYCVGLCYVMLCWVGFVDVGLS